MANRITVSICGEDYTLLAEENPSYMQKVAAVVDAKMAEIMASGRVGRMDAAVLAAANLADEMLKQQGITENLRSQLKGYLDDMNKAKNELSECKRELFKLQQKQSQQQNQQRQNQQNQQRQNQQRQDQQRQSQQQQNQQRQDQQNKQ